MIVGIVGSEAAKFTAATELQAKACILKLLTQPEVTGYSSGHCHLGGIDIWAEQIGDALKLKAYIFKPTTRSWLAPNGYKARNEAIVNASDQVHCITVRVLPDGYTGMVFPSCYHCKTKDHVKSGGCWTAIQARIQGKPAIWHVMG
jgi:hypothetical protein